MKIRCETERHDDESFALKFYAEPEPRIIDPREVKPTPYRQIVLPNAPAAPCLIIHPDARPIRGYIYLADGSTHNVFDPAPDNTRVYLGGLVSRTVL